MVEAMERLLLDKSPTCRVVVGESKVVAEYALS
jgi:hypothetical protein